MSTPLWIIPVLPLLGFVLNGLVALVAGSIRARKKSAAWRHDHPEAERDHGPSPVDQSQVKTAEHAKHEDEHGHDDHGAGEMLPWGLRLFHGIVGVGSVGLAAVVSFGVLVPYVLASLEEKDGIAPHVETVYTWMSVGGFSLDVAFRLDALSALMLSFVTFVGTLIHLYSVGYMQKEEGYGRYFAYLNLFMFAMLTLVLGANLPLLFVGWEGVGLCSYLLIGYYYQTDFAPTGSGAPVPGSPISPSAAGMKAFIANRVGDFGMVLGIFGIFALFGTTDFSFVDMAKHHALQSGAPITVYATCLLLFLGACGKSAQIPLYVWLPDAMAGPTPVSALIHAATMVTAGVYLVARCSAVFVLAPDALTLVAWIGAGTAIFAATIGLAQNDIKRVLAYSTVSQLGYMFLACGVGAFAAGMFHVFTHAFFKACLFLGSGSVIHALHHEQDLRRMGGLAPRIRQTAITMAIATIAIAGIPPFAGFFSKDQILGSAFAAGHPILFAVGLVTAGMTAFYMMRLARMTFAGEFRGTPEEEKHIHESPPTMTVPLWILAGLSCIAGFLGVPAALGGSNVFGRFLEPVLGHVEEHEVSHGVELTLMGLSVLVAAAGIALAWKWYGAKRVAAAAGAPTEVIVVSPEARGFCEKTGLLGRLVANKWNVDEGIEVLVLAPFRRIGSLLWRGCDALVIDGVVNASAFLVELTGDLVRFFTTGNVRNYALLFSFGALALLLYVFVK